MYGKIKGIKLKYKLFLLLLFQALVFLLVYSYSSTVMEKNLLQKLAEHNSLVNFQNASSARLALGELKNICATTLRLENHETVRETETILRQIAGYQNINLSFRNNAKLWSRALGDHPFVRTVAIAAPAGPTVYMSTGSENFFLTVSDPGEEWMTSPIRQRRDYHMTMDGELFRLSRAIINPIKYEKQGVMTVLADLSHLADNFERNKLFPNQQYGLFIGGVKAAGGTGLTAAQVRDIADTPTPYDSTLIDRERGTVYLYYRQNATDEIISITEIPYDAIYGQIFRQNIGGVLAMLVYVAGSLVINTIIIRSVLKSLGVFERAFTQIENGQFGLTVDARVEWELKGFLESFNRMSIRVGELIHEVYERSLTEHKLELQMLRNQINPHFFYNTLEALRMNSLLGNEKDNVEMIEYLSTVLRYGVSSGNDPVRVADEIGNLEHYVALHNMRSDTRIDLRVFIPPDLAGQETIRLLFQPIVENAIHHGISPGGQVLEVQVLGYREGGNAVFTVADNGCGIPAEKAEEINRIFSGEAVDVKMGIGLKNVHRRIQLGYGGAYGLHIQSEAGHGTQVRITMPYRGGDEPCGS